MNKIAIFWATVFTLFSTHAVADVNVVVPGKAAGYLYMQGGGGGADDGKVSLKIIKTPLEGKPLFQTYRIESDPQGLICDENCSEMVHKFPAGQVELKIIGNKPVPGVSIPLTGMWSGDCHETGTEEDTCLIQLNDLNGTVSVQVDGDLETGTIIELPGLGPVMYIDMDTSAGYIMVAAHEQLGPSMTLMEHDAARTADPNIKDGNDGRNNQAKLLAQGSHAAQHCQSLGNGWYLPARYELNKMTAKAVDNVPGFDKGLWSSTEKKFEYNPGSKPEWTYEAYYLRKKDGNVEIKDTKAYRYKLKSNGSVDKDDAEPMQVLCFNRAPL